MLCQELNKNTRKHHKTNIAGLNKKKISKKIKNFIDKRNPLCYNEDNEDEHKKNIIDF